jgi:hypothetical protein
MVAAIANSVASFRYQGKLPNLLTDRNGCDGVLRAQDVPVLDKLIAAQRGLDRHR